MDIPEAIQPSQKIEVSDVAFMGRACEQIRSGRCPHGAMGPASQQTGSSIGLFEAMFP